MNRAIMLLVCVAGLAVDARAGSCAGDPGYTLTIPDFIGIGEPFDVCATAPAGSQVFLLASLGQGPLNTPYGSLCLDFPFVALVTFVMPGAGQMCFRPTLPCDRNALGLTIYLQFVALGPQNGISNQDATTIIDNGRCP
ncbi:MAG: hypothetical protein U1E76_21195 [Planctomycetota bacterium]